MRRFVEVRLMDKNQKPMALRNVLSRLLITTVRHTCMLKAALPSDVYVVKFQQQQAVAVLCYLHD